MSDYEWRALLAPLGVVLFLAALRAIFGLRKRPANPPWWDRPPARWVTVIVCFGFFAYLVIAYS